MTARKRARTATKRKTRIARRKPAIGAKRSASRSRSPATVVKRVSRLRAVGNRARDVGEAALLAATGKPWRHWFALLDGAGAKAMDHGSIVKVLAKARGISGWWQQMITVAYERARGLRQRHETTKGFTANISRTVQVPLATCTRRGPTPSASMAG